MKRSFWFLLGVITGTAGTLYVQKRLSEIRTRYTPPAIANRMGDAVRRFGSDVAESARVGRATMSERETQMRRTRRRRHVEEPAPV